MQIRSACFEPWVCIARWVRSLLARPCTLDAAKIRALVAFGIVVCESHAREELAAGSILFKAKDRNRYPDWRHVAGFRSYQSGGTLPFDAPSRTSKECERRMCQSNTLTSRSRPEAEGRLPAYASGIVEAAKAILGSSDASPSVSISEVEPAEWDARVYDPEIAANESMLQETGLRSSGAVVVLDRARALISGPRQRLYSAFGWRGDPVQNPFR